jgi:hypothetical protein
MFKVPPPPLRLGADEDDEKEQLEEPTTYTIVPGQFTTAAHRRNIVPDTAYGDTWVASSGFTVEGEKETEESYYYKAHCDDSSDNEQQKEDDEDISDGEDYEHDTEYRSSDVDSESLSSADDFMDFEF